jgi:hypothetical protein
MTNRELLSENLKLKTMLKECVKVMDQVQNHRASTHIVKKAILRSKELL